MEYVFLKDVCAINMGQSPDSSSYNDDGNGMPFFQGNADFGDRYPITRKWCSEPTKVAMPEDILISVRAPIGAMNYAKEECCIGRGLAALTPDKSKVSSEFIFWLLKGKNAELNSKGTGSTFKAISRKVLEETLIPDISLDQQIKCSSILEKIYGIIQSKKQELQKLDELVKARFVEMFGDPLANDKVWPMTTLGEIADIRIGPFGTMLHKEDYIEGGHALVNPSHIVAGKIVIDPKLTISDAKYEELSSYIMHIGDVVLGRRGEMGRCAVVSEEGLLCGTGSMVIRPNEKMKPYFLQNIISSPEYKRLIESKAVGVTMMNLNVPIVSSLPFPLLPLSSQDEFITFMHQCDKSKFAIQQSFAATQKLFDSLMQQYFG